MFNLLSRSTNLPLKEGSRSDVAMSLVRGLIFQLFIALTCVAEENHAQFVTNLTDRNFEALVARGEGTPWAVKFYAPWCGHCKVLAPTWEELAEKLQGEVKVGKVDCTESAFLGNLFGIRGFPTLKIISEGKMYTFAGRRSLDSLQEWAQGGYKEQEAADYPFDKPSNKWIAILNTSMTNYGIYGIGVTLICLGILFCYLDQSGSEDAKSRKEMEERLKKLQEAGTEKKAEKEESKKDS